MRLQRPVQRGPADLQVLGDAGDRLAAGLPGARDGGHILIDGGRTAAAARTQDPVYGERDPSVKVLTATVVNRSAHTITGIEGRFRLAGGSGSLVSPGKTDWLSGLPDLPERLRAGAGSAPDFNPCSDRLAPWDTGIRFESDAMADSRVPGAYPVMRWTDRWLTRWEYRQGEVCKIEQGAPWKP